MKERPILSSGPEVRAIQQGRKSTMRRIIGFVNATGMPDELTQLRLIEGCVCMYVADAQKPIIFGGGEIPWVQRDDSGGWIRCVTGGGKGKPMTCPYGGLGDRLWVRETWAYTTDYDGQFLMDGVKALYRADNNESVTPSRWRPSIHRPRWASRITLEVTGVRVERLQEIENTDAIAEGMTIDWRSAPHDPISQFSALWDSINFKRGFGWDANPWVWVISFEKVEP